MDPIWLGLVGMNDAIFWGYGWDIKGPSIYGIIWHNIPSQTDISIGRSTKGFGCETPQAPGNLATAPGKPVPRIVVQQMGHWNPLDELMTPNFQQSAKITHVSNRHH